MFTARYNVGASELILVVAEFLKTLGSIGTTPTVLDRFLSGRLELVIQLVLSVLTSQDVSAIQTGLDMIQYVIERLPDLQQLPMCQQIYCKVLDVSHTPI